MDMGRFSAESGEMIGQYRPPYCYELAGKSFIFQMDDGFDYSVSFINEKTLEWIWKDRTAQQADYLCAKGDDSTYLLTYVVAGGPLRENHTFVIDLENWLVTRILSVVGENPRYPYLTKPKYEFGVIFREGVEYTTYPRHGFTSDLIGTVMQWNYGKMETVHIYYCSDFYRITYPPENEASHVFNSALADLPSSDEPTAYIKIKEGMYLFSLTEANMERIVGDKTQFRSNTMCMLQNYKRLYQIGRTFGTSTMNGTEKPLHLLFGAYGKLRTIDEKFLTDPNPFLV